MRRPRAVNLRSAVCDIIEHLLVMMLTQRRPRNQGNLRIKTHGVHLCGMA